MSAPAKDIDYLLDALPDHSRAEILRIVAYMSERHVPITVENVQHAADADEIKADLLALGITLSDDGRRSQVSPTGDRRGRVMLTFNQVHQLISAARATD